MQQALLPANPKTSSPRNICDLSAIKASRVKQEFETDLAEAPVILYLADRSCQRRLDILPDEAINEKSFTLDHCYVSKDTSLDQRG